MDVFTDRHAYRCLPLSIANTHGWEMLVPAAFEVEWNGGPNIADLTVRALEPFPAGFPFEHFAMSNFARGIVTLHTGYLFRTPPGWSLRNGSAHGERSAFPCISCRTSRRASCTASMITAGFPAPGRSRSASPSACIPMMRRRVASLRATSCACSTTGARCSQGRSSPMPLGAVLRR